MSKIIFILGPPGSGKTTFIQKHFHNDKDCFILDLAAISQQLFGNFDELEGDGLADIYNHGSEEGMFALLEGKTLVVEYCTGYSFDDDLLQLVKQAQNLKVRVEVVQLTLDEETARKRTEQADPAVYYSSLHLGVDTHAVLEGILESYKLNHDFEMIVELVGEDQKISFYKVSGQEGSRYFFHDNQVEVFDFEPQLGFEKQEGVNYLRQFHSFEEAFSAFMEKYPVYQLVPIALNPSYKQAFLQAYHGNIMHPSLEAWIAKLN